MRRRLATVAALVVVSASGYALLERSGTTGWLAPIMVGIGVLTIFGPKLYRPRMDPELSARIVQSPQREAASTDASMGYGTARDLLTGAAFAAVVFGVPLAWRVFGLQASFFYSAALFLGTSGLAFICFVAANLLNVREAAHVVAGRWSGLVLVGLAVSGVGMAAFLIYSFLLIESG